MSAVLWRLAQRAMWFLLGKFALAQHEDQNMKRSRFSEEQIIGILREHEAGVEVAELCRKHGDSDGSIYIYGLRPRRA